MHNIPSHLAAAIDNNSGVTSVRQPINKAFLGRNALPTEKERNVVSADFDATNRLQIVFDTGENIELMWAGTSTALSLDAEPATAFAPAAPAVRCAVFQIND